MISVAADLAGVHPQTLRIYERKHLVEPQRSLGNTRLYSDADIERLRAIQTLTAEGVNLAGVERIIEMQRRMDQMIADVERMRSRVAELDRRARDASARSQYKGEIVLVRRGGLVRSARRETRSG
jgi:MerR family transcriptional regulator/heat shock protein HspR